MGSGHYIGPISGTNETGLDLGLFNLGPKLGNPWQARLTFGSKLDNPCLFSTHPIDRPGTSIWSMTLTSKQEIFNKQSPLTSK